MRLKPRHCEAVQAHKTREHSDYQPLRPAKYLPDEAGALEEYLLNLITGGNNSFNVNKGEII